ncbi:hypothetical protein SAMD00019534_074650 [Acytostelium subglobosum LB1]|uniref:hypothetical protein n=1 Tax=Acytostelium subglobosum LB1 TaxID=1410327 RepID=UPI000644D6A5|nr:hypothetical protein SAMD00019534_074650 [Acytostelium subglobosum LB1]GAM24290.1 hypothetical protein SAMD00019534_074650 [Acytostelium subglobosum LB1]|eukprot:XP_012752616.1 hypothetical protein SAMD00019534_074650 [Acytostelium subglobosum LB1]
MSVAASKNNVKSVGGVDTMTMIKSSVAGAAVGSVFGYALQRSGVYLPRIIQAQMDFSNFTMLKMFMTAALTSSLSITVLSRNKTFTLTSLPVMWRRNLFGGLIMGAGIYLTGSCPGTVLAQVGAGLTSSYFTLLGGLAGAVLYGYVNSKVEKALSKESDEQFLHKGLNVPFYKVTLPFAGILMAFLVVLERFVPWQIDSGVSMSAPTFGTLVTPWSPYVAGLVIGLLQLPSHLLTGSGLGTSSAYCTVSSRLCGLLPSSDSITGYFKKFTQDAKKFSGPALNAGIVLGAYLSSRTALVSAADSAMAHSPLYYVAGGAILLFGARMANGCTSGHGLTGMAKLEIGSLITVASLFAGGIITCFLLK